MEESASTSSPPSSSSILSIWASVNSWFTPTVLFVLLNLMIGTILFTSNLPITTSHHHQQQQQQQQEQENAKEKQEKSHQNQNQNHPNQPKLDRSPSVLHRLKSLNFYPYRSQQDLSPDTHHHLHQEEQEALELAATQYVFNPPIIQHEQDVAAQPHLADRFDFDRTRFDDEVAAAVQYDGFSTDDNEVELPNAETHFDFEQQQPVETMTTRFEFDPTHQETPQDMGIAGTEEDTHEEDETDEFQSLDEVYSKLTVGQVKRTMSDTQPASGEIPPKLPAKMKKSASMKSAFGHFDFEEEEKTVEARRPATVRERKSPARVTEEDDDGEVDAKANDFINKFKHQLKLQRIDSIIRYKDMINKKGDAK